MHRFYGDLTWYWRAWWRCREIASVRSTM